MQPGAVCLRSEASNYQATSKARLACHILDEALPTICDAIGSRMKTLLLTMTGVGFTLGVVFGLLLQLPIDNTQTADSSRGKHSRLYNISHFRFRRSLSDEKQDQPVHATVMTTVFNEQAAISIPDTVKSNLTLGQQKPTGAMSNSFNRSGRRDFISKSVPLYVPSEPLQMSTGTSRESQLGKQTHVFSPEGVFRIGKPTIMAFERESPQNQESNSDHQHINADNSPRVSKVVSVKLKLHGSNFNEKEKVKDVKYPSTFSTEDSLYLRSVVNGVLWTSQLEKSCPRPFEFARAEEWRERVEGLDVVKMEEGCGRMQNRLVTFRDASKACVRYRLNTDQIQGEIYSYYLGQLFNMSNITPSMLARVDSVSSKWRTVHLKLSLAQWADYKLVVLTQHIDGLSSAYIPVEFREEGSRLDPTLQSLGSKSHPELCELVQWSDLIIFDYLTANLDRVINNMFNRQWNDQMMSSPAHNLEKRPDGGLVFLDNESGLFHGYRLLDKYAAFHTSLLHALCVFRESTVKTIKRLHASSSVGEELHKLLASNEVLHKHLAAMSDKNVKILQQRVSDVYKQITNCEQLFNR